MTQYPNTNKQTVKLIESGGLGNKQHKKKDEFVKSNHAQQRINTMLFNYKMGGQVQKGKRQTQLKRNRTQEGEENANTRPKGR